MNTVDCHMHWFPTAYYELLSHRSTPPRTRRNSDGGWTCWKDSGNETLPATWFDLEDQIATLDATGEEMAMISSLGVHSDLDGLPAAEAAEAARAINEELEGAQRRYPGRFFGVGAVPLEDTEMAIDEMEYAVNTLGLRGVSIPGSLGHEPLDSERLEPFYAAAARGGVPLVVHPTDNVFLDSMRDRHDDALYFSLGRVVDSSVAVLRLILDGVFDRHPSLTVVHCHAGGVLPYVAGRLDKNASLPTLEEQPSSYLKRMYVDTVAPDPMVIRWAVEFYGADHVLYGSDNPCWNAAVATSTLTAADLSEDVMAAVGGDNARHVFRLRSPVDAAV